MKQRALIIGFCLVSLIGFQNCGMDGPPPVSSISNLSVDPPPVQCAIDEVEYQSQCFPLFRSCTTGAGSGQQEFFDGAYGPCILQTCPAGQHVEGGTCVSNVRACTIANGIGRQTWTGSAYGACALVSCNTDYVANSNACVGLQRVFRYSLFGRVYHWVTDAADLPSTNYALNGEAFVLLRTPSALGSDPLFMCNPQYLGARLSCLNGGAGSTAVADNLAAGAKLLGYMPVTALPGRPLRPVYHCHVGATINVFLTTRDVGECYGSILQIGSSY